MTDNTNRSVVPILKSSEVDVTQRVLGSGGFCTVSPVRWIKVTEDSHKEELELESKGTSEVSSEGSHSIYQLKGQHQARIALSRQFQGYEEKYHSHKNIVVPGHTTRQQVDPFEQRPPRIALKRIKPGLRKERYQIGVNDLVAEASVLAKCSHPNIISLYAVGCVNDNTEHKDGENEKASPVPSMISFMIIDQLRSTLRNKLYKWKEDRGLKPSFMQSKKVIDDLWLERMVVILKLADAIRYLHSKNFMHRDLNPDNIGFTDDNVVKLFDFGLAKSIKNIDGSTSSTDGAASSNGGVDGDDNEIFDLTTMTGTLR